MRMFTTQHDRPFRLTLYWNQSLPSGSSCIGREWTNAWMQESTILVASTSEALISFCELRLHWARSKETTMRILIIGATGPTGLQLINRSEEHTSELQSLRHLVCRLLLEKKKKNNKKATLRTHTVWRLRSTAVSQTD